MNEHRLSLESEIELLRGRLEELKRVQVNDLNRSTNEVAKAFVESRIQELSRQLRRLEGWW